MSRSRRKHPFCSNACSSSEKQDKKIHHGRVRTYTRSLLNNLEDLDLIENKNYFSEKWCWNKDGKQYFGHMKNPNYKLNFIFEYYDDCDENYYQNLYKELTRK